MDNTLKLKIIRDIDNTIDKIVTIVMLFILLIGVYLIYDSAWVFNNASGGKIKGYKPETINADTLLNISDDCVGWITIDDSEIDYPIMQGADNSEYLSKDPEGNYSLAGSIFLDSQNKADFSEKYILIHGHHMANYYMFGALDRWENKSYYNSHKIGHIFVGDKVYEFNIFAFGYTDAYEDVIYYPTYNYPLDYIRRNAEYFEEPKDEQIVLLSTCRQPNTTRRQYLVGSIHEVDGTDIERNENYK